MNAAPARVLLLVAALLAGGAHAADTQDATPAHGAVSTFLFRDTPVAELFEMISRRERINIMLGRGVTGSVAISLYDVTPRQAIYAIARAGGYQVIERDGGYLIVDPAQAAREAPQAPAASEVRALKVLYSDPQQAAEILARHMGKGGNVTALPAQKMVVVEGSLEAVTRAEGLLREIDLRPKQIMIEAKILEITLDDTQNFGIDWKKILSADGINQIGTTGLAQPGQPGLFFNYVNRNIEAFLSALSSKGRVRTLATPRLLALENQEASTNIGDKLGYRLTTTINNVTSESVQFLETGVILRVTPSVDADGKIVMRVKPEVSSGSVLAGIPSKKTTEVSTQLVAADGQAILIGGLIKTTSGHHRTGVPVLGDVPVLGRLFSNDEQTATSTETIVLITPHIVPPGGAGADPMVEKVDRAERELQRKVEAP